MKIYHNPKCSKSRAALQFLTESNLDFETIPYLDTPPSQQELLEIVKLLNIKAIDLARKGEKAFKDNNLTDPTLSDNKVIEILTKNPILIERPIVVANGKAAIGRPIENIIDIL